MMAIVEGYSSDEDVGLEDAAKDAFGIASLSASKKQKTEEQAPTPAKVETSAPFVLEEVSDSLL